MPLGTELTYSDQFSSLECLYIKIFGVPINGLRIRARRILPLTTDKYINVLDAGCGSGVFTFEMAKRLSKSMITGVDIEQELLDRNTEIARKIRLDNCRFEHLDLTNMDEKDRFDLILSVDNLEHIEDDDNVLRRFYQSLTTDGELIIHVPGYERRWYFFGWAVNFHVEGHCRPGYTLEQLQVKLHNAGFKVREIRYTYGWLETITNNISYWITRAEMENKMLYALVFPLLNFLSYFGRNSRPAKGAGVLAIACKQEQT
ncbi:MAG: class I SAM-dependent methyltransferase [Gemmatimonadota bacterium]|nr:class I SAM-dependent methyltransferase [Gemmatimonadota bacterium]